MTDFETYYLDSVLRENPSLDRELIKKFAFMQEYEEKYPINLMQLVEWGLYKGKNDAKKKIQKNFRKDVDYVERTAKSTGGRPAIEIMMTVDCFKMLCMLSKTDKGKMIIEYLTSVKTLWTESMEKKFELQQQGK